MEPRRRKEFAFQDKVWYIQEVMITSVDNTWRRRWPGVESGFLLWRCDFWRYLLRANWSTGMGFMPGHEWRGQRLNGGVKAYSATLGPCLLKMLLGHKDNDDELCWTTSKGNQRQWWWEFKWAHQLKSTHHLTSQQHQLKGTPTYSQMLYVVKEEGKPTKTWKRRNTIARCFAIISLWPKSGKCSWIKVVCMCFVAIGDFWPT